MSNIHRTVIRVVEKKYLSPNFLRITLQGDDIAPYKDAPLGVNNKIFIPPKGHTTVEMPIFNEETRLWEMDNESNRPTVRTYTHRLIDLEKGLLTMDFAVHEGDSIACDWAMNAPIGSEIGVAMKLNHRELRPEVDNYLFVTDMTGIPVVSAILDTLPQTANVSVIAEVLDKTDEVPEHFSTQANLTLGWVHNPAPDQGSTLSERAITLAKPLHLTDSRFVHVTAEYATVRAIRDHLRNDHAWEARDLFACSYWQIGKRENEPREKRI